MEGPILDKKKKHNNNWKQEKIIKKLYENANVYNSLQ